MREDVWASLLNLEHWMARRDPPQLRLGRLRGGAVVLNLEHWMARRDPPQLRLGRLRGGAVEELRRLHLPSPEIRAQDRRLRVVGNLVDADHFALATQPELAPAGNA